MGMPGISSLMNGCYLFFPAGSRRQVTMPHRMSLERLAHSIQFKVKKKTFGFGFGIGLGDGDTHLVQSKAKKRHSGSWSVSEMGMGICQFVELNSNMSVSHACATGGPCASL